MRLPWGTRCLPGRGSAWPLLCAGEPHTGNSTLPSGCGRRHPAHVPHRARHTASTTSRGRVVPQPHTQRRRISHTHSEEHSEDTRGCNLLTQTSIPERVDQKADCFTVHVCVCVCVKVRQTHTHTHICKVDSYNQQNST